MTMRRFSASTILGIAFTLALFSAALCDALQGIEAGTGLKSTGPHAARSPQLEAGTGAESAGGYIRKELARGLDSPGSIVRGPRGNHYVAVYGAVLMISPDGTIVNVASDLPTPLVLSTAPDGSVYAASRMEGSIYRIAPDGCCTMEVEGLQEPTGITVDRDGNFTVSLAGRGEVITLRRSAGLQ